MDEKKTLIYPMFYRRLLYAVLVFLFLSCSSKSDYAPSFSAISENESAPERSLASKMAMGSELEQTKDVMNKDETALSERASSEEDPASDKQRKRIYNGSTGLVVEDPPEVRKDLENLANGSGGYVEQSYETYLVLRIPAAQFDNLFQQILSMGTVRYQQIDTWDVTDQYQDVQARLSTAEETRRRLYVLLEKSTDPEERARILREIGRLTEEMESIKQQLQILENRIAFSRITVELIPRLQEGSYKDEIPFDWIASLSPLYPVSHTLKTSVKLDPGEEFAVFSKEELYVAEDAHGTSITISSIKNEPKGDESFWQKALYHHLKDYYATAELKDLQFGDKTMPGVEFLSKDKDPFLYFVGLVVEERRIHVVEIFSRDGTKDFSSLYKAFEEGVCR